MMDIKRSGVAIVLSIVWTGLGQLYAGRVGRGLLMMLATPVIWTLAVASGAFDLIGDVLTTSVKLLGSVDTTVTSPATSVGGLLGALGVAFWLVWGMLDAKWQCEIHNHELLNRPI
jgi:TM2 domain-containing membrane protein YozV